jgi:hypothetical protein
VVDHRNRLAVLWAVGDRFAVAGGSVVQSGWPGIAGVLVPYSQPRRNAVRLRPVERFTNAVQSSVVTDRPAYRCAHSRCRARH